MLNLFNVEIFSGEQPATWTETEKKTWNCHEGYRGEHETNHSQYGRSHHFD